MVGSFRGDSLQNYSAAGQREINPTAAPLNQVDVTIRLP
jgi:hypothetical protein